MASPISHLLLLPQDTAPADVEALIVTRYPKSSREQNHVLRITGKIVSFGPLHTVVPTWMGVPSDFAQPLDTSAFTPSLADAVSRMPRAEAEKRPLIFTFTTLRQREDGPDDGLPHRDGLHYVYPQGFPYGHELDTIEMMIAIARRLGGAFCCGETGQVLKPDPMRNTDLTVYSPYWLAPIELGQAVRTVSDQAELATDPVEWAGPSTDMREAVPPSSVMRMSPTEAARVEQAADAFDAEALAGGDEIDGYAYVVPLGRRGESGEVEVRAGAEEAAIPALASTNWDNRVISYALVWGPPDDEQAAIPHPSADFLHHREAAQHAIRRLTASVHNVVQGVIVDSDGFIVHPDWLR